LRIGTNWAVSHAGGVASVDTLKIVPDEQRVGSRIRGVCVSPPTLLHSRNAASGYCASDRLQTVIASIMS
jgi:hypothetical protein